MTAFHHQILRLLPTSFVHRVMKMIQFQRFRSQLGEGLPPILVYQMGKVGSRSVLETLQPILPDTPLFHFHYLNPETLSFTQKKARFSGRAYPGDDYWISLFVREQLLDEPGRGPLRVITLTRDPVARNLSGFFQSLAYWAPGTAEKMFQSDDPGIYFKELRDVFLNDYHHQLSVRWFEREMRDQLGIDLFQEEFPVSQGFAIRDQGPDRILILRLEDLDRVLQPALERFLGQKWEDFDLRSTNRADDKDYNSVYRAFAEQLVLPEDFLRECYTSRYAEHFYSEAERQTFFQSWGGQGAL